VPAFFTKIILQLKNEAEKELDKKIRVEVLQVNKDAPVQMQLLCELSAPFLKRPWEEYEPEFKLLVA